jgi:precorrin-2 dehydrogenase/sirohydrochlorin ferrochelatase
MGSYPIVLNLEGKRCLVIGGGRVALRKVIGLLRAGAQITVVAPCLHKHFRHVAKSLTVFARPFEENDITSALALIIGATDNPSVNKAVSAKAKSLGILCNIVDCPSLCSFTMPAVVRRGDLSIAIATGGKSPRLSRYIKTQVARAIGPEYEHLVSYMAQTRIAAGSSIESSRARALFWKQLFAIDPLQYINQHGWDAFRARTEQLIASYKRRADSP